MLAVLLTIHMIACVALVIAVMLQRSEGGALGMGGGGTGGIISGRGAAGVLVKTTMGLALVFFITSITMTRMNNDQLNAPSALERQANETPVDPFAPTSGTITPAPSATAPSTTPAPAPAIDPLAPATNNTAPATTPAAPATTTPTEPAPTP